MNQHVKPMTLIKETDYGTPHPEVTEATKLVTLEIDGLRDHGAGRHVDHECRDAARH